MRHAVDADACYHEDNVRLGIKAKNLSDRIFYQSICSRLCIAIIATSVIQSLLSCQELQKMLRFSSGFNCPPNEVYCYYP